MSPILLQDQMVSPVLQHLREILQSRPTNLQQHHCMMIKWGGALGYLAAQIIATSLLAEESDKTKLLSGTYEHLLHIRSPKTQHLKQTALHILHTVSLTAPKPKIVIIEDIDRMHPVCANMLLKTLEEPPTNTYFLCTTNQYSHVLPTITSRATVVTPPISKRDVTQAVASHIAPEYRELPLEDALRIEQCTAPQDYLEEFQEMSTAAKHVITAKHLTDRYLAMGWLWDTKRKERTYLHATDWYRYMEVLIEESLQSGMMARDHNAVQQAISTYHALAILKRHGSMHVHKKAASLRFLIRSQQQ